MDGERRKHRGGGKSSKDRRPLKSVQLSPPDYKIQPQILTESYIEKEVRFAGIVSNIPIHLDTTNRTDVLRVIDRGKREENIPWKTTYEHDAIFALNVHNVNLSRRVGQEEVLLRLPIHEIASMCYIRDDDYHVMGIKFGEIDYRQPQDTLEDLTCKLAVLYCDSRAAAEELCSMVEQCFQLVYTEATMQFLDRNLSLAGAGMSISSSTLRSEKSSEPSTPNRDRKDTNTGHISFLSNSNVNLASAQFATASVNADMNGTYSSMTSRSLQRSTPRRSSASGSEIEQQLIGEYMKKLMNHLNMEEMKRFAQIIKAWHTNLAFLEFCEKVLELYGPARKQLLVDMRPFIPQNDLKTFDAFLERVGLGGVPGSSSSRPPYNRQMTGASGYSSTAGFDERMNEITENLDQMGQVNT